MIGICNEPYPAPPFWELHYSNPKLYVLLLFAWIGTIIVVLCMVIYIAWRMSKGGS